MGTAVTTTTCTSVDEFLDAVAAGRGIPVALYADGSILDATVPGWHFRAVGGEAITAEYATWFTCAGRFEELDRHPTADGEVVSYVLTWEEHGELYAARHCHVISLDRSGRISRDAVWCGGRWGAALLAEMGAADHA